MGKLYLHIGTHKTGTSAIQSFLYKQGEELLEKDRLIMLKKVPNTFHTGIRECSAESTNFISAYTNFFHSQMKDSSLNYFYSNEELSGNPSTHYKNNRYVFDVLKKAIPPGFDIEIIVVFRRQDAYLQSIFTEYKHHGGDLNFRDLFKNEYTEALNWLNFIEDIKEVFGEQVVLHVLPYEPLLLQSQSILQLVGKKLNISFFKNTENLPDTNVGFSRNALKLYDRLADSLDTPFKSMALRKVLQDVDNKGVGKEYSYLTYDEKMELLAFYDESNKQLSEKYWKKEYDMDNFSMPVKESDQVNRPTEELAIRELLGYLERQHLALNKIRKNYLFRAINKISRMVGIK